ncbi:hypothetical protein [Chelativorans sp. YIM 93263]|uniref:hypothetical protein n=1 Tax=Chelativorans sp. YIM 93263 TaxID=2906648 RepID=UPI00403E2663
MLIIKGWARIRLSPVSIAPAGEPLNIDRTIRRTAEILRNEGSATTFNAWHEPVHLGVVDAWLLPELDGTKDQLTLLAALDRCVHEGKVAFERQGAPVVEPSTIRECVAEHVGALTARLAAQSKFRELRASIRVPPSPIATSAPDAGDTVAPSARALVSMIMGEKPGVPFP